MLKHNVLGCFECVSVTNSIYSECMSEIVISLMVQIGAWFGAESFEIRRSLTVHAWNDG